MAFGAEMKEFAAAFKIGWDAMAKGEDLAYKSAWRSGFESPSKKRDFQAAQAAGVGEADGRLAAVTSTAIPVRQARVGFTSDESHGEEELVNGLEMARGGAVERQPMERQPPRERGDIYARVANDEDNPSVDYRQLVEGMKRYMAGGQPDKYVDQPVPSRRPTGEYDITSSEPVGVNYDTTSSRPGPRSMQPVPPRRPTGEYDITSSEPVGMNYDTASSEPVGVNYDTTSSAPRQAVPLPPRRPKPLDQQMTVAGADARARKAGGVQPADPGGWSFTDPATTTDAVHSGLMWLQKIFFGGGVSPTALPASQGQNQQGASAFARNVGSATPQEYQAAVQAVDPQNRLTEDQKNVAALNAGYKWHVAQGNPEGAQRYAASMLMYIKNVTQKSGAMAQVALENGDIETAAKWIQKGYNYIPDNKSFVFKVNPDGKTVDFQQIDNITKKSVQSGRAGRDKLIYIATGAQNGEAWLKSMAEVGSGSGRGGRSGGRSRGGRRGRGSSGDVVSDTSKLEEAQDSYFDAVSNLRDARAGNDPAKIEEAKQTATAAKKAFDAIPKSRNDLTKLSSRNRALGLSSKPEKDSGEVDLTSAREAQEEVRQAEIALASAEKMRGEGDDDDAVVEATTRLQEAQANLADLAGAKGVATGLTRLNRLEGGIRGSAVGSGSSTRATRRGNEQALDLVGPAQAEVNKAYGIGGENLSADRTSRTYPKPGPSQADETGFVMAREGQQRAEAKLSSAQFAQADLAYGKATNQNYEWGEEGVKAVEKAFKVAKLDDKGRLPKDAPVVPEDVLNSAKDITYNLAKRNDLPIDTIARATYELMAGDSNFTIRRDGMVDFGSGMLPVYVDRASLRLAASVRDRQQSKKSTGRATRGEPAQGSEMQDAVSKARGQAIDLKLRNRGNFVRDLPADRPASQGMRFYGDR